MAIVNTGDDLVAPILQSGWTVVSDGFGLRTSVSVYKADYTSDLATFLVKGTAHPDAAYSYLKIDKFRISYDALDMATVTVDYVGIDPNTNNGVRTNPNTSSANGLTSEPLTSHPNFFTHDPSFLGVIAGAGPYTEDTLGPRVQSKTTPKGPDTLSFTGSNGACFESEDGGRFIGFVDPIYPSFYGKTNYLATVTSYSGVMYSTQLADVQALLALLNTATATATWGVFVLLPSWAPIGTVANIGHVNLLSQVNVEQFGSLYKINYEIRYSKTGWDDYVYTNI